MRRQNARARKGAQGLTPSLLRAVVTSLFRRRNDYGNFDVSEVICQLRQFGVADVRGLRLLMKKHRRSILADENRKMARAETLHLLDTFYPEGIDVHSNTSWFAVTGLVREAMGERVWVGGYILGVMSRFLVLPFRGRVARLIKMRNGGGVE